MAIRHILLSVVLFEESGGWSAVCLEHNIAAQGATVEKARQALGCAIIGQLMLDMKASRQPLANFKPAPERYWQLFENARQKETRPIESQESVPPAYIVEAIAGHSASL